MWCHYDRAVRRPSSRRGLGEPGHDGRRSSERYPAPGIRELPAKMVIPPLGRSANGRRLQQGGRNIESGLISSTSPTNPPAAPTTPALRRRGEHALQRRPRSSRRRSRRKRAAKWAIAGERAIEHNFHSLQHAHQTSPENHTLSALAFVAAKTSRAAKIWPSHRKADARGGQKSCPFCPLCLERPPRPTN